MVKVEQRHGWDRLAATAALLGATMSVVYVVVVVQQSSAPAAWYLGGLIGGTLLTIYGAPRGVRRRGLALGIASVILVALGVLGLLSIGAPILIAGILAGVAAFRAAER